MVIKNNIYDIINKKDDIMKKKELINKSVGAGILIALGDYVLLKIGNPFGPIIFSFGLLGVCYMGQNLFTGKCGFIIEDKIPIKDILLILIWNLIAGYLMGIMFSFTDNEIVNNAILKITTWNVSIAFLIKSILCGIIMYIAVYMYRQNTPLGIIFGIPLFIFSGFQHCIANIVTMGIAKTFHPSIIICIIGNFIGSICIWYFSKDNSKKKKKG